MGVPLQVPVRVETLDLGLQRDGFMRRLVRELVAALSGVIGEEEAEGFVSLVGQRVGVDIHEQYKSALEVSRLSREQLGAVLTDLKRRIEGDFYLIEESEQRIVLGNRRCPFGDQAEGLPALCMMTSNVFGVIAAETIGYAKVDVEQAIARGDAECRVVIHLQPSGVVDSLPGREYYRAVDE